MITGSLHHGQQLELDQSSVFDLQGRQDSGLGLRGKWERLVKKGRHRRFEEARSLKRATEPTTEQCPECGADPEEDHASWCLAETELEEEGGEASLPG